MGYGSLDSIVRVSIKHGQFTSGSDKGGPGPIPEPEAHDPSGVLSFVVDATDVNNLRHWDGTGVQPETDQEIEQLPTPTEGQTVFAIKNTGSEGGWFVESGSNAALRNNGLEALGSPSNYRLTTDVVNGNLIGLAADNHNGFCELRFRPDGGGESALEVGFSGEWGDVQSYDYGSDEFGGAGIENLNSPSVLAYLGEEKHPVSETDVIPTATLVQGEWGPVPFEEGGPYFKGRVTRGFAGHHSQIPDFDWATHGPALKAWLEEGDD